MTQIALNFNSFSVIIQLDCALLINRFDFRLMQTRCCVFKFLAFSLPLHPVRRKAHLKLIMLQHTLAVHTL